MKKTIAGIAMIATLLAVGSPALAETSATGSTTPTLPAQTGTAQTGTAQTVTLSDSQAQLPAATITPDQLLYGLKLWIERIELALIRDAVVRGSLLDQQAQTRMAEAKAMAEAGKADLAQQALADAKSKLAQAQAQVTAALSTHADATKLTKQIQVDQAKFVIVVAIATPKVPAVLNAAGVPVVVSGTSPAAAPTGTVAPVSATVLSVTPIAAREHEERDDEEHGHGEADAKKMQHDLAKLEQMVGRLMAQQIVINPGQAKRMGDSGPGKSGKHGGHGEND